MLPASAPLALLLAAAAPASAATGPCAPATAEPAEIHLIQSDYEEWRGRCVRLRGIAVGRRLYADRRAFLEPIHTFGGTKRSIVVYSGKQFEPLREARRVELVGTVFSCADHHALVNAERAKQPPGTIMWVSGYCHTSLEHYVQPRSIVRLDAGRIPRFTEAELPPRARPLVEAPAELPDLAAHVAAARALVVAIADGDETAFVRLTRPSLALALSRESEARYEGVQRRLAEAREELERQSADRGAELRRLLAGAVRAFVDRRELAAWRTDEDPPVGYVACWCRQPDCAGRWPVTPFDADNAPERPYFCVRTSRYLLGPRDGSTLQAEAPFLDPGFAEPD